MRAHHPCYRCGAVPHLVLSVDTLATLETCRRKVVAKHDGTQNHFRA